MSSIHKVTCGMRKTIFESARKMKKNEKGVGVWDCIHAAFLCIHPIQSTCHGSSAIEKRKLAYIANIPVQRAFLHSGSVQIGAIANMIVTPCLVNFFTLALITCS